MGSHTLPPAPENKDFNQIRAIYPEFIYEGYDFETRGTILDVCYRFNIPGLSEFRPKLSFPLGAISPDRYLDETARRILFNIGMIELISYWKSSCSPTVRILAGSLDADQIRFWKELYFGGLGEFFFRNEIETNINDFMFIDATAPKGTAIVDHSEFLKNENGSKPFGLLVPVGGGKDSVVSLCRLAEIKAEVSGFAINATQAVIDTLEVAGIPVERRLFVERRLDPNMLALNRLGYWNGHTPFSALVAFISMYVAYVHDLNYIVLSNEASANEASVAGTDVNHQFSKSTAFETAFQHYTQHFLGVDIYYFSLMRPFSELAIAREFSKHPGFFDVFRSCNVGSKQNRWCANCAKCLFIACVLSPFLKEELIHHILDRDIFNADSLLADLEGLCGRLELKPWECVGTVSEVNVALTMTICQRLDSGVARDDLDLLFRQYMDWVEAGEVPGVYLTAAGRPITVIDEARGPLQYFHTDHRVPAIFLPYIESMLEE